MSYGNTDQNKTCIMKDYAWISEGKFWWTEDETQHKYNRLPVSQVNIRVCLE